MQRTDNAPQPVGPGQGGAVRRAEMKNLGATLTNTVNRITNNIQERKAREQQGWFDNFAKAVSGQQEADAEAQEAFQAMQAARQKGDMQAYTDAAKRLQSAMQKSKQNQTIQNDLASDKKKWKVITTGFGIDDKNASKPERQQAIAAYKKANPQANENVARLMSQVPQTQQLTPQARGQAITQAAGLQAKPATPEELLRFMETIYDHNLQAGAKENELKLNAMDKGFLVEKGADGKTEIRPMTPDERIRYQPEIQQRRDLEEMKETYHSFENKMNNDFRERMETLRQYGQENRQNKQLAMMLKIAGMKIDAQTEKLFSKTPAEISKQLNGTIGDLNKQLAAAETTARQLAASEKGHWFIGASKEDVDAATETRNNLKKAIQYLDTNKAKIVKGDLDLEEATEQAYKIMGSGGQEVPGFVPDKPRGSL
jgi:hypothetical protein